MSIGTLVAKQNSDGGWPYARGGSWTEPTVYAIMALLDGGETSAARRGLQWLQRVRQPDGGFAPRPDVDQSTWVTALVALLPPEKIDPRMHQDAIAWLMGGSGQESTALYRLRCWLLGVDTPKEQEFAGWPWLPGTSAWVGPTSLTILALEKEDSRRPSERLKKRIAEGRGFLLRRMCLGGGWNHGAPRALGYQSRPYPESTGMALAALRGTNTPDVQTALSVAVRFLQECRSADALNWLRLGLHAHNRMPAGFCVPAEVSYRTVPEASLDALVAGVETGRSMFWA
jgi:hypothetical protein